MIRLSDCGDDRVIIMIKRREKVKGIRKVILFPLFIVHQEPKLEVGTQNLESKIC